MAAASASISGVEGAVAEDVEAKLKRITELHERYKSFETYQSLLNICGGIYRHLEGEMGDAETIDEISITDEELKASREYMYFMLGLEEAARMQKQDELQARIKEIIAEMKENERTGKIGETHAKYLALKSELEKTENEIRNTIILPISVSPSLGQREILRQEVKEQKKQNIRALEKQRALYIKEMNRQKMDLRHCYGETVLSAQLYDFNNAHPDSETWKEDLRKINEDMERCLGKIREFRADAEARRDSGLSARTVTTTRYSAAELVHDEHSPTASTSLTT